MATKRSMNRDPERSSAMKGNQNAKGNGGASMKSAAKSMAGGATASTAAALGLMHKAGTLGAITAPKTFIATTAAKSALTMGAGGGVGSFLGAKA